jgi:hypothetical protein
VAQSTYSLEFHGDVSVDYVTVSGGGVPLPAGGTAGVGDGDEMSISLWVWFDDTSDQTLIMEEPTNSRWLLFVASSTLVWRGNSSSFNEITAAMPSTGAWHHVVAVLKNYIGGVQYSYQRLYVDGVLVATGGPISLGSGSSTSRFTHGSGDITLGYLQDISAFPLNGKLDDVALFDYCIDGVIDDTTDIQAIYDGSLDVATLSPVGLWRLETGSGTTATDTSGNGNDGAFTGGVTWSASVPAPLAGGGAATYTLTAAAGSYALTGQSAGLLYGRKLAAGAGTYTLTGQAATLRAARLLGASQGSYTLTGQAAGLLLGHRLAAGQGSYTLTGQAAGLLYGRRLGAAQGAYALTGQDATLVYSASGNKVLAAAQGSYALTGQAANLLYGRRLAAGQGAYALSGQAAGLYRGLRLAAAQGSYALTGQQAALRATRQLGAAQGTYTLTGQAAALLRGYRVVGGLGTYTLAGQAAALSRTRSLLALPGAYALTGRDATLSRSGTELPPTFRAIDVIGRSGTPDVVGRSSTPAVRGH